MKKIILAVSIVLCISCKQNKEVKEKELTIAEKIAYAHGFENWKQVKEIAFTFNVEKDSSHFERSWRWNTKSGEVVLVSGLDTLTYNRKQVDTVSLNADKAFINDKFWLLAPFQLVWDAGTQISEPVKAESPISKTQMNKITITYTNDGGYTPGDAYDFYFGDDYIIKEWVFRKGNSKDASLTTTWEDYENYAGLQIATSHKKPEDNWKLHFTGITIKTD
ncbi:hypothetical protein ACFQ0I_13475 [Mariniflexile aquimaris]|uniref:Uncharacterized protein n=1 Tax=Mariniflexile aquimaris TaxID=881009 RepID=A0ABW3BVR6_9FLAO